MLSQLTAGRATGQISAYSLTVHMLSTHEKRLPKAKILLSDTALLRNIGVSLVSSSTQDASRVSRSLGQWRTHSYDLPDGTLLMVTGSMTRTNRRAYNNASGHVATTASVIIRTRPQAALRRLLLTVDDVTLHDVQAGAFGRFDLISNKEAAQLGVAFTSSDFPRLQSNVVRALFTLQKTADEITAKRVYTTQEIEDADGNKVAVPSEIKTRAIDLD